MVDVIDQHARFPLPRHWVAAASRKDCPSAYQGPGVEQQFGGVAASIKFLSYQAGIFKDIVNLPLHFVNIYEHAPISRGLNLGFLLFEKAHCGVDRRQIKIENPAIPYGLVVGVLLLLVVVADTKVVRDVE